MKAKRNISKRRLEKHLNELIVRAKAVSSDLETFIHIPGDEGQHAWIEIYAPDEFVEQIGGLLSAYTHDIYMKEGYDIGTIVFEKSELQEAIVDTENKTK
jgi:hypothetical protein